MSDDIAELKERCHQAADDRLYAEECEREQIAENGRRATYVMQHDPAHLNRHERRIIAHKERREKRT